MGSHEAKPEKPVLTSGNAPNTGLPFREDVLSRPISLDTSGTFVGRPTPHRGREYETERSLTIVGLRTWLQLITAVCVELGLLSPCSGGNRPPKTAPLSAKV